MAEEYPEYPAFSQEDSEYPEELFASARIETTSAPRQQAYQLPAVDSFGASQPAPAGRSQFAQRQPAFYGMDSAGNTFAAVAPSPDIMSGTLPRQSAAYQEHAFEPVNQELNSHPSRRYPEYNFTYYPPPQPSAYHPMFRDNEAERQYGYPPPSALDPVLRDNEAERQYGYSQPSALDPVLRDIDAERQYGYPQPSALDPVLRDIDAGRHYQYPEPSAYHPVSRDNEAERQYEYPEPERAYNPPPQSSAYEQLFLDNQAERQFEYPDPEHAYDRLLPGYGIPYYYPLAPSDEEASDKKASDKTVVQEQSRTADSACMMGPPLSAINNALTQSPGAFRHERTPKAPHAKTELNAKRAQKEMDRRNYIIANGTPRDPPCLHCAHRMAAHPNYRCTRIDEFDASGQLITDADGIIYKPRCAHCGILRRKCVIITMEEKNEILREHAEKAAAKAKKTMRDRRRGAKGKKTAAYTGSHSVDHDGPSQLDLAQRPLPRFQPPANQPFTPSPSPLRRSMTPAQDATFPPGQFQPFGSRASFPMPGYADQLTDTVGEAMEMGARRQSGEASSLAMALRQSLLDMERRDATRPLTEQAVVEDAVEDESAEGGNVMDEDVQGENHPAPEPKPKVGRQSRRPRCKK